MCVIEGAGRKLDCEAKAAKRQSETDNDKHERRQKDAQSKKW